MIFNKVESPRGIWLYPENCVDKASHVFFRDYSKKRSEGFGGREIPFNLVDGSVCTLQGPWHSNADGMFRDTEIDLRSTHYTLGCISKVREAIPGSYESLFKEIVYLDEQPVLGLFDRVSIIAENMLINDEQVGPLYVYSESRDGSSSGMLKDKEHALRERKHWFDCGYQREGVTL